MRLVKFWKSLTTAERDQFATRAALSKSMICQIISGAKIPSIYACVAIEKASDGTVRCETLNPKIPWRYLQLRGGAKRGKPQDA
jgi:DNA-binding transcriptional regulator YdaS (Cro superfamily)